jgi:hypothetical protein
MRGFISRRTPVSQRICLKYWAMGQAHSLIFKANVFSPILQRVCFNFWAMGYTYSANFMANMFCFNIFHFFA